MTTYYQCDLSQGSTRTTAYIEERGAKLGAKVEIKTSGFDGLWEVIQVADKGIEGVILSELQKNNRNSFGYIL